MRTWSVSAPLNCFLVMLARRHHQARQPGKGLASAGRDGLDRHHGRPGPGIEDLQPDTGLEDLGIGRHQPLVGRHGLAEQGPDVPR